jgi:hypothetical protein
MMLKLVQLACLQLDKAAFNAAFLPVQRASVLVSGSSS